MTKKKADCVTCIYKLRYYPIEEQLRAEQAASAELAARLQAAQRELSQIHHRLKRWQRPPINQKKRRR